MPGPMRQLQNSLHAEQTMKRGLFLFIVLLTAVGCDNSYRPMSAKYRVRFSCRTDVAPFNQLTTPGRFLSVRISPDRTTLTVTDPEGKTTTRPLTETESASFALGLGGLILGIPLFDNNNMSVSAYDLACPFCDQERYRLDFDIQGIAKCSKCGNSWSLNSSGFPSETVSSGVRPLYGYPVTSSVNGTISVSN